MSTRQLIERRWIFIALAAAMTIAYCIVQLRSYRHRLVDPDALAASAGLALSALLGYPLVLGGAYAGSVLVRGTGRGWAIALLLFVGIWGLTLMAFGVFMGAMQTKPFDQALLFGAVLMIGGFFVAAAWTIMGGDPTRLNSWTIPLALFLTVIIVGLWHLVLDITNTSWNDAPLKIGAVYGVTVILLTISVGFAVRLALKIVAE